MKRITISGLEHFVGTVNLGYGDWEASGTCCYADCEKLPNWFIELSDHSEDHAVELVRSKLLKHYNVHHKEFLADSEEHP